MSFKFLEHTADLKVAVEEKTIEKAFKTSAVALKEVIAEKIKVKPVISKSFTVRGSDYPQLLYSFLEEFIYLLDAKNFLFSKILELKIISLKKGYKLSCNITGDKSSNYNFTSDVKAITYNHMKIFEKKKLGFKKWRIEFVLDL